MIDYQSHVQDVGWTDVKEDGETSGTVGEGKRLEALIVESSYNTRLKAHVQNIGWQDWVGRGEIAGTVGQGLRMEAFRIELIDPPPNKHIWYRVHVENVGWTEWDIDGEVVGSVGEALRIEAIEIMIVDETTDEDFIVWYDESKKCKLGDVIFSVTTGETVTVSNDVTNKAIEGGSVSDHVSRNPVEIGVSGMIFGDDAQQKLETIRGYADNGDALRYVGCDTANNMVIKSFSTDRSPSIKDGASFSLSLQEIPMATGVVTVIDEAYIFTQMNNLKNGGLQAVLTE